MFLDKHLILKKLSIYLICILFTCPLLEGSFYAIYRKIINGRMHPDYAKLSATAVDEQSCHKAMCSNNRNCAVSFHVELRDCYLLSVSAQVIYYDLNHNKRLLTDTADDSLWKIIFTKPMYLIKSPKVLWLFDHLTKGKNIGIGGSQLDYPNNGLKWKDLGPEGNKSSLRYPRGDPHDMYNPLWVVQNDKRLIHLKNGFTVAMWIKIDNIKPARLLLNNGNFLYDYEGFDLWLLQSKDEGDKLAVDLSGRQSPFDYVTIGYKDNNINAHGWKHVALVYKNKMDVRLYINGQQCKLSVSNPQTDLIENKVITLWTTGSKDHSFDGAKAHLSIHEEPLNSRQILKLMENSATGDNKLM